MKKILFAIFLIVLIPCFGYAETLSLSSFYPSRYGEYSQLRLMPIDTGVNPITCDSKNTGLMYYDSVSGDMVVCGDSDSEALLVWRMEGAMIHPIDIDGNLFVGIGDESPDALIEISASGLANDLLMLSSDDANDGDILRVQSNGNIGIGSRTPSFRLTIDQDRGLAADGGILSFGTVGSGADLVASGAGTRMFWYPKKAAFRAGTVTGEHWDDGNIGNYSVALGFDVSSKGVSSTSIGSNNSSDGNYAVSIGDFNGAIGNNSVAIGYSLVNNGVASVTIGKDNQINDPSTAAIAIGNQNQVIGDSSVVMGEGNASLFSVSSIAMGYQCGAYGLSSIALGYKAQATESYSIAIGYNPIADEILAVAMGSSTQAIGFNSFAIGKDTISNGQFSAAFNIDSTAQAYQSNVFGRFNVISGTTDTWIDTEPLFVVGNGSDDLNRSNAITVLKNGTTIIGGDNPDGVRFRVYGGDAVLDGGFSWKTDSDRRLKKDIIPIKNVLEKVMHLRGVRYNLTTEADEAPKRIGFIAQELEKEFPEVVKSMDDGYKGLDYTKMNVVLIEAIKELKEKNDALKERMRILKEELDQL